MEITISRLELYPKEEPKGYAVGFVVTLKNGKAIYRDTVVGLEDCRDKSDEEIAKLAYANLRDSIEAFEKSEGCKSSLIGTQLKIDSKGQE